MNTLYASANAAFDAESSRGLDALDELAVESCVADSAATLNRQPAISNIDNFMPRVLDAG